MFEAMLGLVCWFACHTTDLLSTLQQLPWYIAHLLPRYLTVPLCLPCLLPPLQELDDCEAKFRMVQQQFSDASEQQQADGAEEPLSQLSLGNGAVGPRRPQLAATRRYLHSHRAGLGAWVDGLGVSAAQLARNVEEGYKKHIPTDLTVSCLLLLDVVFAVCLGFEISMHHCRAAYCVPVDLD
jgi:hypothetical protein